MAINVNKLARYAPFRKMVEATSVNRLRTQFEQEEVGVVGAFKGSLEQKVNLKRSVELGKAIRQMGYGFVPIKGYWKSDESGITYIEPSFWIPKCKFNDVAKLSHQFEQEAFIYAAKGEWGLYLTGQKQPVKSGEDFNLLFDRELADAYSELGNRNFRFTSEPEAKRAILNVVNAYIQKKTEGN